MLWGFLSFFQSLPSCFFLSLSVSLYVSLFLTGCLFFVFSLTLFFASFALHSTGRRHYRRDSPGHQQESSKAWWKSRRSFELYCHHMNERTRGSAPTPFGKNLICHLSGEMNCPSAVAVCLSVYMVFRWAVEARAGVIWRVSFTDSAN